MIMEDSLIYILKATLALMFCVVGIDIYLLIKRKMTEKKIDNIEKSLKAKDEEQRNVLQSLRGLHESMKEINKLNTDLDRMKEEVNKIKVLKK